MIIQHPARTRKAQWLYRAIAPKLNYLALIPAAFYQGLKISPMFFDPPEQDRILSQLTRGFPDGDDDPRAVNNFLQELNNQCRHVVVFEREVVAHTSKKRQDWLGGYPLPDKPPEYAGRGQSIPPPVKMTLVECFAIVPDAVRKCRVGASTFFLVASRESLNPSRSVTFINTPGAHSKRKSARRKILRRLER